jgi:hypothetical protein
MSELRPIAPIPFPAGMARGLPGAARPVIQDVRIDGIM